jgi:4-amino-4-deoxy-L-arabinose transferase-like glycosyltransferase
MTSSASNPRAPAPAAWWMALAILAVHVAVNAAGPYEFHRDELLYLAMGRHLQWWRMDFPPFIAAVARLTQSLGGGLAPWSVRLAPAIAAAAMILLSAWMARRLGGGPWAQGTAALAVAASPLFLRSGTLFQPVVFDQLWWTLGYASLLLLSEEDRPGWWALAAMAVGLGMLTKFSIGFFGGGVLVGALSLAEWRRRLRTPRPWLALGAALLIGSASIVGQVRLGWPVRGQIGDLQSTQLARIGVRDFLAGQLLLGPAVLLAAIGAWALLGSPRLRGARILGVSTVASFVLLALLRGKPYYIGPIYPALWAAGAVAVESASGVRWTRGVRRGTVTAILLFGVAVLPFGLPFLPPPVMARYAARAGAGAAVTTNMGDVLALPQDYADMLGWKAQAEEVARVYHALPEDERRRAIVVADNYGEAGALDLYGPALGLPPVISSAGTYWYFGPGTLPGEVAVVLGEKPAGLRKFADSVVVAGEITNRWAVPEEMDVKVLVARRPRTTVQALWPTLQGRH